MGNHSETAEILEEAWEAPIKVLEVSGISGFEDEYGNTIELGNPTRLKDSTDRDVEFLTASPKEAFGVSEEVAKTMVAIAKRNKKKSS